MSYVHALNGQYPIISVQLLINYIICHVYVVHIYVCHTKAITNSNINPMMKGMCVFLLSNCNYMLQFYNSYMHSQVLPTCIIGTLRLINPVIIYLATVQK